MLVFDLWRCRGRERSGGGQQPDGVPVGQPVGLGDWFAHEVSAEGGQALRQRAVGSGGARDAVGGDSGQVGQGGRRQGHGEGAGDGAGDVGHAIVDHALLDIGAAGVGGGPAGFEAAALVDGDIDRHTAGPHAGDDVPGHQAASLRWLYAEAISILTLNLIELTGRYRASDAADWPGVVRDRLAEGGDTGSSDADCGGLCRPAHRPRVDRGWREQRREDRDNGRVRTHSAGMDEPFIELVDRLSVAPGVAALPRQTDLIAHERLVRRRHVG